jgi:hypothetical protein
MYLRLYRGLGGGKDDRKNGGPHAGWFQHAGIAVALTAALQVPLPAQESPNPSNTQAANSQTVSARVDSLLAAMTTDEKAGQMMQYFQLFPDTAEAELKAKHGQIGSLLFMTDLELSTAPSTQPSTAASFTSPLFSG